MDERDWTILHELYLHKNITKTAKQLYITQPALTKRLMHIEEDLQVKIVNRGIRGVHFTQQGEYLARRAAELLGTFRQIREDVLGMGEEPAGRLRLGVSNYFGKYELPLLLRQFREQHPRVEFHLDTAFSKGILERLYQQEIHVGFVRGHYSWSGPKHLLFQEQVCIVSQSPIDLAALPSSPRIDYFTDPLFKAMIDHWWGRHFNTLPLISMKVDRADTCREMVRSGLGYAFLPARFLSELSDLNQIVIRDPEGQPLLRETWMFYHEESLQNPVVRSFVEFIRRSDLSSLPSTL